VMKTVRMISIIVLVVGFVMSALADEDKIGRGIQQIVDDLKTYFSSSGVMYNLAVDANSILLTVSDFIKSVDKTLTREIGTPEEKQNLLLNEL